jgi:enoyl-CoA hydratase/carnithine racemase
MSTVLVNINDKLAIVTLNRPDALNAINEEMLVLLMEIFSNLEKDERIQVVVLKGNGRAFSAGVDLKNTDANGFAKDGKMMLLGRNLCKLIANSSKVTIAQVHGYCFTGALELALCFDLIYCTPETQFGDTHAKFGIMPRWGMSQRLPRRVGMANAKEMSFRAMRIIGPEAQRIGLVNRTFEAPQIDEEVLKIAQEINGNFFQVIQVVKNLMEDGFESTLDVGLQIEADNEVQINNLNESIQRFGK